MNHWTHLVGHVTPPQAGPAARVVRRNGRVRVSRATRLAQRRAAVLEYLRQHGHAPAQELAKAIGCCQNTVKTDIAHLIRAGHAVVSSGGWYGGYVWIGGST